MPRSTRTASASSLLVGVLLASCVYLAWPAATVSAEAPPRPYSVTEEREPCSRFEPSRLPFFGDIHVHTTYSQDASTQDTRVTPRDAYRFAKGEPLDIQPYDADGNSLRTVAIDRPLDFTVVTDHAEQLGETHICKTPGLEGHDSFVCQVYRRWPRVAFYVMNARATALDFGRWGFCGEDGEFCLAAARTIWGETQDAAEEAYDRSSACSFTSFVGYEWTAGATGHLHRNVVFRNALVPDLPVSKFETGQEAIELWKQLDSKCRDGVPGCEALTIPHNSNIGNGMTFTSATEVRGPIPAEEAPIRQRYDRLAEVMQHKGDSECAMYPGVNDESCAFETVTRGSAGDDPELDPADLDPINYVRDALKRGVELERRLGTNPLKYGMIASTDTHLGTPGLVKERGHPGHGGGGKHARDGVPKGLPDYLNLNPGGLAVVWAEENTRDALFEAMRRRETYGTSGTRPLLRFFGGWDYDTSLCDSPDVAAQGYARGVSMGGDLPAPPIGGTAPRFVVSALRDPSTDAAPLERIEIIKGWVENGERKERVVLAAGGPNASSVDLASCERRGEGASRLCSVWADPDFDAAEPAFYYARLLENPSCRWSQWACVDAGVDCSDASTVGEGFEACCSEHHARTVQERAWSSPIWWSPPAGDSTPGGGATAD